MSCVVHVVVNEVNVVHVVNEVNVVHVVNVVNVLGHWGLWSKCPGTNRFM